ncbi:MAG: tRNA-dihydrouridine synthase, partial [Gammaproteobacteria bacterium]
LESELTTEKSSPALSREEVRGIILSHLEALYAFYGEETGVRIARKHLGWYFASLPDSATLRPGLMAAATTALQFAVARGHLDGWVDDEAARAA